MLFWYNTMTVTQPRVHSVTLFTILFAYKKYNAFDCKSEKT